VADNPFRVIRRTCCNQPVTTEWCGSRVKLAPTDEGAFFALALFAHNAIALAGVEGFGGDQQGLHAALQYGFLELAHQRLVDAFALLLRRYKGIA